MLDSGENLMGTPLPSFRKKDPSFGSSKSIVSPLLPSPSRLWRPAAQRNIRNQWSKLLSCKDRWASATSEGRLHATELVNCYLNLRYLPEMDLGALMDIPGVREKACDKLAYKQAIFEIYFPPGFVPKQAYIFLQGYVLHLQVVAVYDLGKASRSMRCYMKGSCSNPIIEYSNRQDDLGDSGDGGGIPVFSFLSISLFEELARELVNIFMMELSLKRFLVIGLVSINGVEDGGVEAFDWSNELYHGEFDDLRSTGMLKQDNCHLDPPQIMDFQSSDFLSRTTIKSPDNNILEVYLTIWISNLNINMHRVKEIFSIVEEEMKAKLL